MNNPLCEGSHCTKSNSRIRLIPLDDSCTVKMCASCYVTEMDYNDSLSIRILPKIPFSIFPLYVHSQDECNRVLAEADEYPAQLNEYFKEVYTTPFKEIPFYKLEKVL